MKIRRAVGIAAGVIGVIAVSILMSMAFGADPPFRGRVVGAQIVQTPEGPRLAVFRSRLGSVTVEWIKSPSLSPP